MRRPTRAASTWLAAWCSSPRAGSQLSWPVGNVESERESEQIWYKTGGAQAGATTLLPGDHMPREAVIGPQIVEAVEAKVGEGLSRTQAFAAVAQERGSRTGTVAANYYRMVRKTNPKVLKRRKSRRPAVAAAPAHTATPGTTAPSGRRRRGPATDGTVDVARLANELIASVQALAEVVKSQQTEVRGLRSRLDQVKSALR